MNIMPKRPLFSGRVLPLALVLAAGTSVAVLAAAQPPAGAAAAATTSEPPPSAPEGPTDPRPPVPDIEFTGIDATAIDVMSRRIGVDRAEARRRIEIQNEVIALAAAAEQRYPADFGGLWIDLDNQGKVVVTFTGEPDHRLASVARGFSRPDLLVPATVARSQAQLRALKSRISADRETLRSEGISDYGVGIDTPNNIVYVHLPPELAERRNVFTDRYGSDVRVDLAQLAQETSGCPQGRLGCDPPIRGGIRVRNTNTSRGCTSGFNAKSRTTTTFYVLTAGHCDAGNYEHRGTYIGAMWDADRVDIGEVDAGRIRNTGSYWGSSRWIFGTAGQQARAMTYVSRSTNLPTDIQVCNVGSYSDLDGNYSDDCGFVLDGQYNCCGGRHPNQLRAPGCALEGDSGSPVFNSGTAFGIAHASTSPLTCDAGDYYVASYAVRIEDALNVYIQYWTDVNCPSPC